MSFSGFANPLMFVPQPLTAVGLGVGLNLFFQRYPELKARFKELSGKRFRFEVEDLFQEYTMEVEEDGGVRIYTYSDLDPDVIMSGEASAFIALLLGTTDPDSLFFSRRLNLSGETDVGVRFKNILDNVDVDWEKELAAWFGSIPAQGMVTAAKKVKEKVGARRESIHESIEAWMDDNDLPRHRALLSLQEAADEMAERSERLAQRLSRAEKRLGLARSSAETPADTTEADAGEKK